MPTIRATGLFVVLAAMSAAAQAPHRQLPEAPSATRERLTPPAGKPVVAVPSSPTTLSPAERPYKPLTPKQKLNHFLRYSYSMPTMFNVMYNATYAQAIGDPSGYGGGMAGYGKRVGASLAGTEAGSFFGMYLFPVFLHQDPRYFPMYNGGFWRRGAHAASRLLITRNDDGRKTVNSSGLLAIAFNEALKNAYLPEARRDAGATFERMLGSMQGVAGSYVLQEFMPDMLRLFRRHAPAKLIKLEDKIPPQILTGAPSGGEDE